MGWIESFLHLSPDGNSGVSETLIAAGLAIALFASILAVRRRKTSAQKPAQEAKI